MHFLRASHISTIAFVATLYSDRAARLCGRRKRQTANNAGRRTGRGENFKHIDSSEIVSTLTVSWTTSLLGMIVQTIRSDGHRLHLSLDFAQQGIPLEWVYNQREDFDL